MSRSEIIEINATRPESSDDFKKPNVAPINNRIANLALIHEPRNLWLSSTEIAYNLGTDTGYVEKTADKIGIATIEADGTDSGNPVKLYQPISIEILSEELTWQREYLKLDEKLSARQIGDFIGRGRNWTAKTLAEIGIKPAKSKSRHGTLVYHRSVIKTLREINLSIPPDDGWLTLTALADITGSHKEWIARQLNKAGITSETRRSSLTSIIREHYPPESIDLIIELSNQRPPASGAWLYANVIRLLTGKTQDWVELRLKNQYSSDGELRLDDERKSIIHYPPHVLDNLLNEIKELQEIPESGDYITKHDIAKKIGKSVVWVTKRIKLLELEPEIRLNRNNRPSKHYPPCLSEILYEESEKIKEYDEMGDYMTANVIAITLEKDPKWIVRRLNFLAIKPEIRINKSNHIFECYPPEVVEVIRNLPTDILK